MNGKNKEVRGIETMDYTQPNTDTHVRIKAPTDKWESYLNKGLYDGVIYEIPDFRRGKTNENNFNMFVPIQFLSGDNKGKKSSYILTFSENSLGRIKRIFDSVGIPYKHDPNAEFLDFERKDLKGIQLKALVTEETWQGKTNNKITMIFNKAYVPEE